MLRFHQHKQVTEPYFKSGKKVKVSFEKISMKLIFETPKYINTPDKYAY